MAESATDQVVRARLTELGFIHGDNIVFLPQGAKQDGRVVNEMVWEMQQGASKSKSGEIGYPDFVIEVVGHVQLIFIIEDKEMKNKHEGPNQNIPDIEDRKEQFPNDIRDYAVDGVLWYAKIFSRRFNVIALAVSGSEPHDLRVSSFMHRRGAARAEPLAYPNAGRTPINDLEKLDVYLEAALYDPQAILNVEGEVSDAVNALKSRTKGFEPTPARALTMSALVAALSEPDTWEAVTEAHGFVNKREILIDALQRRYRVQELVAEPVEHDVREGGGEEE